MIPDVTIAAINRETQIRQEFSELLKDSSQKRSAEKACQNQSDHVSAEIDSFATMLQIP